MKVTADVTTLQTYTLDKMQASIWFSENRMLIINPAVQMLDKNN